MRQVQCWVSELLTEYDIVDTHQLERLANLAGLQDEKFDLQELAKETPKTFVDRWLQPKASPVFKMLHDVYVLELRYVRELGLDLDLNDSRPPGRPGGY